MSWFSTAHLDCPVLNIAWCCFLHILDISMTSFFPLLFVSHVTKHKFIFICLCRHGWHWVNRLLNCGSLMKFRIQCSNVDTKCMQSLFFSWHLGRFIYLGGWQWTGTGGFQVLAGCRVRWPGHPDCWSADTGEAGGSSRSCWWVCCVPLLVCVCAVFWNLSHLQSCWLSFIIMWFVSGMAKVSVPESGLESQHWANCCFCLLYPNGAYANSQPTHAKLLYLLTSAVPSISPPHYLYLIHLHAF